MTRRTILRLLALSPLGFLFKPGLRYALTPKYPVGSKVRVTHTHTRSWFGVGNKVETADHSEQITSSGWVVATKATNHSVKYTILVGGYGSNGCLADVSEGNIVSYFA